MNTTSTFQMKPKLRILRPEVGRNGKFPPIRKWGFGLLAIFLLAFSNLFAQTTHLSPTGASNGGFESGTAGWNFVANGTTNWSVGTAGPAFAGSNSAYISLNGGTNNNYDNAASRTSHMYRDFTIPAIETDISLSFQHKGVGESGWDRLLVYVAPNTFAPTAGTPASNSTANGAATLIYTAPMGSNTYGLVSVSIPGTFAGTTMRLIFTWQNDNSFGSNPPSSVDNITLVSNIGPGNYYSKASATNFADPNSWGANTDGTGASPSTVSNADNFIISNGSAMVLNANASVRTLSIFSGSLTVAANQLTVAIASQFNSTLSVNSAGTLNVSGGTIQVNGNVLIANNGNFIQSNGLIVVDGNNGGSASNSVPGSLDIFSIGTSAASYNTGTLNLTGGTIRLVDPHTSTATPLSTVSGGHTFFTFLSNNYNAGPGHTIEFGNGTSTDAGGNTSGYSYNVWPGSTRFYAGNIVVNAPLGTNRFVSNVFSSGCVNLTVTLGEFRIGTLHVAGNLTNNGTLTTTGTLVLGSFTNGTSSASTLPQTISGAGVFRNSTITSTANFTGITFNNTNPAGVTFSGANSLLSPGNTGTVSGTLTFTAGLVSTGVNRFILGRNATNVGTFGTYTSGGFTDGSTFGRWIAATGTGTTITASTAPSNTGTLTFPFAQNNTTPRFFFIERPTTTGATGGVIAVTYNAAGSALNTITAVADGAYSINSRSSTNWSVSFPNIGGVTFAPGTGTFEVAAQGTGIFLTSSANTRIMKATTVVGNFQSGTAQPLGQRAAITATDISNSPWYIGINDGDLSITSAQTGNWNLGSTWVGGVVPNASSSPVILSGHVVTVTDAQSITTVPVSSGGTLTIAPGGTLSVSGSAASTGINVDGTLNVTGGTLNVGPTDNSLANRRISINSGGTLNVSGGTANIAGDIQLASGGTFIQSGGNINIDPNANGSTTFSTSSVVLSLNVANANSVQLTGGTLTFVDPPINSVNTVNLSGAFNGSVLTTAGHTIAFGNGTSNSAGSATGWNVNTWVSTSGLRFGNLVVNGPSATNRFLTSTYQQPVIGNVTVNNGGDLRIGSLLLGGDLLVNTGGTYTATGNTGFMSANFLNASSLVFNASTSAQSITNSGTIRNLLTSPTANLTGLILQNSNASGVTLNSPLSVSGLIDMQQGNLNTTSTNLLTHVSTTSGNVNFGTNAGYINGPHRVTVPTFTNFTAWFPVGKTQRNYLAFFNAQTTGPVTIQVETNNTLNTPNTTGPSLLSLVAGREWVTSIVSGAANLTGSSVQIFDNVIVSGDAIAGIQSPATDFSMLTSGNTFFAAASPLPASISGFPSFAGTAFPDRIAIGKTGPLNVNALLLEQSTVSAIPAITTPSTTNNNSARLTIPIVGSSGTVALDNLTFNYTGTIAPANVTAVTLWRGTFGAPGAVQIGSTVISGGLISFVGLNENLISGNNYLWLRFNVNGSAIIGQTFDVTLLTSDATWITSSGATAAPPVATLNPSGLVTIDYCPTTYAFGCSSGADGISLVNLAGSSITLNNSSGCPVSPFYTYYPSVNKPDLQQGSTYSISITLGSDPNQYSRVWVDFDQNGVFDAAESFSAGTNAFANGISTFNIVVPAGAALGFTRMRVRGGEDVAILNTQACGASSNGYGETEDYIVEITTPTPASVSSITATQQTGGMAQNTTNNNLLRVNIDVAGSAGTLTLNQMRFTLPYLASDIAALGVSLWTGNAGAPTTQIGTSQNPGATVNFTGLTTVLNSGTNYVWLRVNTSATAVINNLVDANIAIGDITIAATGGAISPGSQPTAAVDPAGERFIDYCVGGTVNGGGTDAVLNVNLVGNTITLNQASVLAASPYYSFFNAAPKPDLFQGSSYNLTVNMGTDPNQFSAVWVDFNRNGVFETSEYFSAGTNANPGIIPILVPATAVLGDTRMRVRAGSDNAIANNQACGILGGSQTWGEVEDYIVTIIPPPDCSTQLPFPPATAATASRSSLCSGDNVSFNITTAMPSGTGITYQWRRNGVNFGAVQSSAAASFAVTASGNYDVVISCNGTPQVTSASVSLTVNSPTVATTVPASRCGAGTLNLNATASAGASIEWYADPTSTLPIGSGNTFTTPSIGTTTTYYAAAVAAGSTILAGPATPTVGTVGSGFTGTWQRFNTLDQIRIVSFDVNATVAGTVSFELRNSAGTVLANYSTNTIVVGINTLPVNWVVPSGIAYEIWFTAGTATITNNSAGMAGFYTPTSYAGVEFTANSSGNNNAWRNVYNIQVETICRSPRSAVVATVTPAPNINTNPSNTVSICEGQSTTLVASSTNLTYTYTWTPGPSVGASYTVSPLTTTTYTVNGVTSTGCTNSRTVSVIVNPRPAPPTSVVTTPAVAPGDPVPFCPNLSTGAFTPVAIGASASPVTGVAFFENFTNGFGAAPWTAQFITTNSAGHGPLAQWTTLPDDYQYNSYPFTSDGSFAGSFGDAQNNPSESGTANLTSPVISINPLANSVQLSYSVALNLIGSDFLNVQYSTDGITWVTIPGENITAPNSSFSGLFTTRTATIPAAAYASGGFRLRFNYFSDWGWWVAIDNVTVTQTVNSPSFTWTPAGGLFNDIGATTPYVENSPISTIYAAPFNDRTYQVSTQNPLTGCSSLPGNITVDVCQIVIDQICGAQTVNVLNSPPANINALPSVSNFGAPITGSLAGLCAPLKSDVWFKAVIPASGDVHVYTFSAGSGPIDLDSTVVAIYSSSDGTCNGVLTQLGCDAFNGPDGHTYASASGLTPGSNVFIRVGSRQANLFPESGRFKLVVMSGLFWTGAANNQVFNDPLNWYGADGTTVGIAPSANKSVIIPQSASNNYPFITGNVDVYGVNFLNNQFVAPSNAYRINLDVNAKLRINSSGTRGGFVIASQGIAGSLPSPRISGAGFVEFINTSVTPANNQHFLNVIGSASAQLIFDCVAGVKSNATLTTNNRMTIPNNGVLLSGGVQTTVPAINYGGTVIGNIRYTRSGSSYGNFDYWSSPILNGSTSALNTSFGSNLYEYDNTRPGASSNVQAGWNSAPISAPVAMTPGKGYIQTYAGNGSVTFNGLPTQVDLDLPVTVSGTNNFNLVGNPYPSSLSTAAFRARNTGAGKVGLGSMYFWNQVSSPFNSGNYVVVNSSNIVASGTPPGDWSPLQIGGAQAMMVEVATSGDLEFRNDDRVPSYPTSLTQWFSTPESISLVRLKINNDNGMEHNTVVAFSESSSDDFISGEDSPRLPGTTGVEIYSLLEPRQLNIQMLSPLTSGRIVDLGFVATTPGQYSLSLTEFVEFDPSVRVFLEDRANNTFQNLNTNPVYQFDPSAQVTGVRFRLHFMAPIATSSSATCLGETNGKVIVSNQNLGLPVDMVLKNAQGTVISTASQVVGEHIFQNLASGSYNLTIAYDQADQEELLVSVNTVGLVSPASFVMSSNNVNIADAIIEFNAGDDQSIEYTWDFGDGSPLVTGTATPVHAYMAPGVYTVTLVTGNGGCTSTATTQITVSAQTTGISRVNSDSKIVVFPNPATSYSNVLVNWNATISSATMNIFDATGRLVNSQAIKNMTSGSVIAIPVDQLSNGIYQISIEGDNFHEVARFTVAK